MCSEISQTTKDQLTVILPQCLSVAIVKKYAASQTGLIIDTVPMTTHFMVIRFRIGLLHLTLCLVNIPLATRISNYLCKNGGEGNAKPFQYSCLENPMDGGAWWAAVHGVATSRTRLSNFTFTFYFHTVEKAKATHSSVLAWRIPGMAEPGGLLSMGSHRVGHD